MNYILMICLVFVVCPIPYQHFEYGEASAIFRVSSICCVFLVFSSFDTCVVDLRAKTLFPEDILTLH